MARFQIPKTPEQLLDPDFEGLHVKEITNPSELAPQELLSFAESKVEIWETMTVKLLVNNAYHPLHAGVVYDICEHDALCISEQGVFDGVYSLVRCVSWVPGTLSLRYLLGI